MDASRPWCPVAGGPARVLSRCTCPAMLQAATSLVAAVQRPAEPVASGAFALQRAWATARRVSWSKPLSSAWAASGKVGWGHLEHSSLNSGRLVGQRTF